MPKSYTATSQIDKFKQAAKEAECDTDEAAFDRALKRVAKSEPPDKDKLKTNGKKPSN